MSNPRTRAAAQLLALMDLDTARRILQQLGNEAALRALEKADQVRYARHLLETGLDRQTIVIRLQRRYQISKSTAYLRLLETHSDR